MQYKIDATFNHEVKYLGDNVDVPKARDAHQAQQAHQSMYGSTDEYSDERSLLPAMHEPISHQNNIEFELSALYLVLFVALFVIVCCLFIGMISGALFYFGFRRRSEKEEDDV